MKITKNYLKRLIKEELQHEVEQKWISPLSGLKTHVTKNNSKLDKSTALSSLKRLGDELDNLKSLDKNGLFDLRQIINVLFNNLASSSDVFSTTDAEIENNGENK